MNGVINVNKPKGFTSHDVVAKLRGILSIKKIGHTGTLDPDATGVLPICVGRATKTADMLTATEKEYVAKVILGAETDTQDASGTVLKTAPVNVHVAEIKEATASFVGDIMQIPPMYSAIKQDGKKLYELARKGQVVERQPRPVTIFELEILEINLEKCWFTMRVKCSKGTYIRTLCQDIGEKLGCFAHMGELERTKSGQFSIENSYTLDQIRESMDNGDTSFLTPIDQIFSDMPTLVLSQRKAEKMCNGTQVSTSGMTEGVQYRVYDENGRFLTISTAVGGLLKIEKTFYQE
ncbi:MAG: tRNA pseudouridine(55) synthase TruB [Clostridia bacterium]|nr:tRNA pseudouridine(55) synthase TruB [Clostridia bacterium]